MALHEVLSAMREIILDAPDVPTDNSERLRYYLKSFPKLSKEEANDLAKIDPKKFKLYTTSIFVAEKSLIENNFPMTVKVLHAYWFEIFKEDFDLFLLVQKIHKIKPWKSTTTVALGRNFVEYLSENLPEVIKAVPYIIDLATLELITRKIKKAPEEKVDSRTAVSLIDLENSTVDKLMNLRFEIPGHVNFRVFSYDVVSARSDFISGKTEVPKELKTQKCFASAGRNLSGLPSWVLLEEVVHNYLNHQPRKEAIGIESLAETIVSSQEANRPEEELFAYFVSELAKLVRCGVIRLSQAT